MSYINARVHRWVLKGFKSSQPVLKLYSKTNWVSVTQTSEISSLHLAFVTIQEGEMRMRINKTTKTSDLYRRVKLKLANWDCICAGLRFPVKEKTSWGCYFSVQCLSVPVRLTFLVLDYNVPDVAPGAGIDSCSGFIQNHHARAPY